MGNVKAIRGLQSQDGDEVLCDLDAVLSHRVTFTFQGKTHALLPITTALFFEFWAQVDAFRKGKQETAEETNAAFYAILKPICPTVTVAEAQAMTVVQKAALLRHLVAKIVGNKTLAESLQDEANEKKNALNPVAG